MTKKQMAEEVKRITKEIDGIISQLVRAEYEAEQKGAINAARRFREACDAIYDLYYHRDVKNVAVWTAYAHPYKRKEEIELSLAMHRVAYYQAIKKAREILVG